MKVQLRPDFAGRHSVSGVGLLRPGVVYDIGEPHCLHAVLCEAKALPEPAEAGAPPTSPAPEAPRPSPSAAFLAAQARFAKGGSRFRKEPKVEAAPQPTAAAATVATPAATPAEATPEATPETEIAAPEAPPVET